MAEEKMLTASQVAGAAIGAVIGSTKGTVLGATAALAVAPLLGIFAPLALILLPAGTIVGTLSGASIGSKGLDRAAWMVTGCVAGDLIPEMMSGNDRANPST